jgi:hypothetical protein
LRALTFASRAVVRLPDSRRGTRPHFDTTPRHPFSFVLCAACARCCPLLPAAGCCCCCCCCCTVVRLAQLSFCQAFGPLDYLRVIFPYLEDCLYVFPTAPPRPATSASPLDESSGGGGGGSPRQHGGDSKLYYSSPSRTRALTARSLRGAFKSPSTSGVQKELSLQCVFQNALVTVCCRVWCRVCACACWMRRAPWVVCGGAPCVVSVVSRPSRDGVCVHVCCGDAGVALPNPTTKGTTQPMPSWRLARLRRWARRWRSALSCRPLCAR